MTDTRHPAWSARIDGETQKGTNMTTDTNSPSADAVEDADAPVYEREWTEGPTLLRISAWQMPEGLQSYLSLERDLPDGNVRIVEMVLTDADVLALSGSLEQMVHACQRYAGQGADADERDGVAA